MVRRLIAYHKIKSSAIVEECTLKVDIRIVSGDSIILGAHTKNLAFFGNGFPSLPGSKSDDSVIRLEEEAEVLQLLLRFMHNIRQPDLSLIPFSQLFSLAEAAEKYLVYSAMESCKTQMECACSYLKTFLCADALIFMC